MTVTVSVKLAIGAPPAFGISCPVSVAVPAAMGLQYTSESQPTDDHGLVRERHGSLYPSLGGLDYSDITSKT